MKKENWIENARKLLVKEALNELLPFNNYVELQRNVRHVVLSYGLLFSAQEEGIFNFIKDLITAEAQYSSKELKKKIMPKLRTFFSTHIK
jgi:tRNA-binding EMAP/Myf-like protein